MIPCWPMSDYNNTIIFHGKLQRLHTAPWFFPNDIVPSHIWLQWRHDVKYLTSMTGAIQCLTTIKSCYPKPDSNDVMLDFNDSMLFNFWLQWQHDVQCLTSMTSAIPCLTTVQSCFSKTDSKDFILFHAWLQWHHAVPCLLRMKQCYPNLDSNTARFFHVWLECHNSVNFWLQWYNYF